MLDNVGYILIISPSHGWFSRDASVGVIKTWSKGRLSTAALEFRDMISLPLFLDLPLFLVTFLKWINDKLAIY